MQYYCAKAGPGACESDWEKDKKGQEGHRRIKVKESRHNALGYSTEGAGSQLENSSKGSL